MATAAKQTDKSPVETFSDKIMDAQQRNVAFFTRANEIVAEAVRAIWANEMDLIRMEPGRAGRLFQTVEGHTPLQATADYAAEWHENSEKVIAHIREITDLARKCCWQLCDLYVQNVTDSQKAEK